jgi:hypothetical protein
LVLNLIFVIVGFKRGKRLYVDGHDSTALRRSRWITVGIATWALLVYISSIPANIFTSFEWYRVQYGGVAAIVTALVLPLIARPPATPA